MAKAMTKYMLRLPEEMHKEIKRMAYKESISMASLYRLIISRFFSLQNKGLLK